MMAEQLYIKEKMMLEPGIKGTKTVRVTSENTAKAYGSGQLEVFATPAMIALIEQTAWQSVAGELGEGEGTVGTRVDVSHSAATPLGMEVRCETELMEVDRRRLVFRAEVFDEAGLVGEGTHERFIIRNEPFLQKANQKKQS